jgi:hypothetical protein
MGRVLRSDFTTPSVGNFRFIRHYMICYTVNGIFWETFSSATDHKKSHKHAASREKYVISLFNDSLPGNSPSIKIIPITEAELKCIIHSFKQKKIYHISHPFTYRPMCNHSLYSILVFSLTG